MTYAELTDHGLDVATRVRTASAEILRRRVLAPLGPEDSQRIADAMRALREVNGDTQEGRPAGRPDAC